MNANSLGGCTECFCMGVTRTCDSTTQRRQQLEASYSVADWSLAESSNDKVLGDGTLFCIHSDLLFIICVLAGYFSLLHNGTRYPCSECFCMGVTRDCQSYSYSYTNITDQILHITDLSNSNNYSDGKILPSLSVIILEWTSLAC